MPPRFGGLALLRSIPGPGASSTASTSLRALHSSRPLVRTPNALVHANSQAVTKRSFSIPSKKFAANHPYVTFGIRLTLSAGFGLGLIIGVILAHDAFTYSDKHADRVPINPLSLHPRRGGKKNLPILEVNLDAEEIEKHGMKDKPRLVIIGGGWGAVSLIQSLPTDKYNVTLISPQTYFAFTPLLPAACVGTVEPRSLVEPLRKLVARVRGHYLMGSAVDLDMSERLVEVEVPSDQGDGTIRCYVPYDKLVIGCGSTSNDHGVKGLQHCFQLKTIPDAQAIRRRVMTNLELASLPTTSPEERKRLLSFVVCGGGPTGVEFAAELRDMMAEDVLKYYPKLLESEVRVTVVQSRDHILNTYAEKISQYAEQRFKRSDIQIITNARVQEVSPEKVTITIKDTRNKSAKPHAIDIPAGFVLWSTGIAMQPFTKRLVELLPNQYHSKAVEVDNFLRVRGAPKGTVYALGDAATVHTDLVGDMMDLWDKYDTNKDNKLDYDEWADMCGQIKKSYPLAQKYLEKVQVYPWTLNQLDGEKKSASDGVQSREIFEESDVDKDNTLSLNEVATAFQKLQSKITSYPATAQVASQQGKYLAGMFGKLSKQHNVLDANEMLDHDDEMYYEPFSYRHLGSLAYIGNSAVLDYEGYSITGGLLAMYAWRSIYWSEQTSMRTRMLIMVDWVKRGIFGRDLSKF